MFYRSFKLGSIVEMSSADPDQNQFAKWMDNYNQPERCWKLTKMRMLVQFAKFSQSLMAEAEVICRSSFVSRQSRQRHPVAPLVGEDRQCVREIGAPAIMPWIAGHGGVAV
jgi:hypothetical protein